MEVALDARVSTPRQQQPPTIDQQLSRLRDSVATHPDGHVADEPLLRRRLQRRPSQAAWSRSTARSRRHGSLCMPPDHRPDRCARHYVHQMLLVDARTQRGGRSAFVERAMSTDPHDQLLLPIRAAVAE